MNESATLANVGNTAEALDAIRRAVDVLVRSDVTPADRPEYTRQLAMTRMDLVFRLTGRPVAQFIAASHEAIVACQQAVTAGNDAVTVAGMLRTLSSWAAAASSPPTAVDAIDAAAQILRASAPVAGHEVDYYRTLALVLFDLFARQVTAGHTDLATAPAEETIPAFRQLAATGSDPTDAANSLLTLSLRTFQAGMLETAAHAAQGAVDILQAFAPTPASAELDQALSAQAHLVLANRLIAAGHPADAVAPANAAVNLYQTLASTDPAYQGLLAEAQGVVNSLG